MTKYWRKKYSWKLVLSFFDKKLQFTHVQATGEAFSPKKNIQHFKKGNLLTFSMFVGHFCPLGYPIESGSSTDPDPQHWLPYFLVLADRITGSGSGSTLYIYYAYFLWLVLQLPMIFFKSFVYIYNL
jgi:hypothetical protein